MQTTCHVKRDGSMQGMSQQKQGATSLKRLFWLWSSKEDKALVDSMLELRLEGTFDVDNGLGWDFEKKMESKIQGCGLKAIPHM
ncbi:putative Myb/SANT-like domain-containing protein [Senna tora]|uniref:Putative Myb/SANT-like domain-containing protein n=1 Tax=Senna tora TaxID=362788 RepID=A0A834X7N0_9FABA|nr:putative Myb/SANT-like domain-containing protein [Senna tora]